MRIIPHFSLRAGAVAQYAPRADIPEPRMLEHETPTEPTTPAPSGIAPDRRAILAGIGGLAAGALLAGKAHAGPLEPPPGPIAPTPGPEPRTPIGPATTPGNGAFMHVISQSGSYYLGANLLVDAGLGGILIEADEVTLDLNGFALIGRPGSGEGIRVESMNNNATIRNGSVALLGNRGVRFTGSGAGVSRCEHLTIRSCGGDGLAAFGPVEVTDCRAFSNLGHGFDLGNNSTISRCFARSNLLNGIRTGNVAGVAECIAIVNGQQGIGAGAGCFVRSCVARENTLDGIATAGGSTVESCNATLNGGHGVIIGGDGTARHNDCAANGRTSSRAGVYCSGADSRIESNNCTNNGVGIQAAIGGNIVLRNTCSGSVNDNFVLAAGNRYGPIVDLTAQTAPAVAGSAAADSTGTTHPWANFAY